MKKYYYEIQIPDGNNPKNFEISSYHGDSWNGFRLNGKFEIDTKKKAIKIFNTIKKDFEVIRLVQYTTTPEHTKTIISIKQ